jgi:hypothetical protein
VAATPAPADKPRADRGVGPRTLVAAPLILTGIGVGMVIAPVINTGTGSALAHGYDTAFWWRPACSCCA